MWFWNKKQLPEKLHICLIAEKFPILGRAADHGFLWPIAKGLARRGHHITVLSWKNPQGEESILQDGVQAFFLGERTQLSKSHFPELTYKKFSQLHNDQAFHLVHSVDASGYIVGLNKKKHGLAMTYDVEATQLSLLFSILGMAQESLGSLLQTSFAVTYQFLTSYLGFDRKLLKTADAIFVTSPQQRVVLERYYLYPELKTYLVPYGIEMGDLSPRERSDELRERLQLPLNSPVVATLTDMTEFGEMRNVLRAFEKVAIKKPSARLIIIGHGPLKKEIEFEMLNLALGSKVVFTGAITGGNLPDYIALADIFVNISSRTTGFEPSLLEAMAQKKVIIGSEVSPISTIVEDGKDGFLIRPADVSMLSQLILKVFSNELPADQIGESARHKVLNLFDTNKMVNFTLEAFYKALLNTGQYKTGPKLRDLQTSPA